MRYFAIVAYSGEGYHGFQRQPKKTTVQGEIEKQLSLYFGTPITIKGAGRTDAGVHAKGQTFSFDAPTQKDVGKVRKALNRLLPEDIFIRHLQYAPEGFDARHSSCGKVYEYTFTINDRDPLKTKKIAQLRRDDFDFDAFLQALKVFEGTHNFQNFTTKPEDNNGYVRTVESIEARRDETGNLVTVRFKADGFMRYQIRIMLGAAFKAAVHKMNVAEIQSSLCDGPRKIVAYKAPAEGLCLVEVLYDGSAGL